MLCLVQTSISKARKGLCKKGAALPEKLQRHPFFCAWIIPDSAFVRNRVRSSQPGPVLPTRIADWMAFTKSVHLRND